MAAFRKVERVSAEEGRELIAATMRKASQRSKYRAKRITIDGHNFPSLLEARRYGALKLLVRAGHVRDLKLQPRFPLMVDGVTVGTYVADFRYEAHIKPAGSPRARWVDVVEDAKGAVLPLYVLKRALFRVLYSHLAFVETKA